MESGKAIDVDKNNYSKNFKSLYGIGMRKVKREVEKYISDVKIKVKKNTAKKTEGTGFVEKVAEVAYEANVLVEPIGSDVFES